MPVRLYSDLLQDLKGEHLSALVLNTGVQYPSFGTQTHERDNGNDVIIKNNKKLKARVPLSANTCIYE